MIGWASQTGAETLGLGPTFAIHPRHPRHFIYAGQPFFFVGKSAFALIDSDWKAFIDEAHRDGFTVVRIWLSCPSMTRKHGNDRFQRNQAAGDLWAFGGTPAKPDFGQFNEDYFRRLDSILDYLHAKGMVAELTLFTGGDFWPGGALAWDEVKRRYVEFVLDRHGSRPNLYFEVANEYYSQEQQAFVEKVGDFIWERDQAHLVTASAGELGRFANKPWYRLHNFHPSRGRDWWTRVYDEVLLPARNARLPMVSDEPMGSRGPDDLERGYPGRDGNPAHHRMNFWVTVLGGGHVTFHSHKGINALAGHSPGQEFVKPLRAFFEQLRFWELAPAPERVLVGTACVAASANELVMYLPNGSRVTLDLDGFKSGLTARWFDPRDGHFGPAFKVAGGSKLALQAPDGNDWTLHLQTQADEDMVEEFTSPDSGFFVLARHEATGEMWAGTYGGDKSRLFVKRAGVWKLHTELPETESVFRLLYHPATRRLYANSERYLKGPCLWRLEGDRWVNTGVGDDYPEKQGTMGLGLGIGADGALYAGVTPYTPGRPTKGYVWRSTDGANWEKCSETYSVAKHFLAYRGKTYALLTFGKGNDRLARLGKGGWETVSEIPDGRSLQYGVEFRENLYLGGTDSASGKGAVYRYDDSTLEKVFEAEVSGGFVVGFAKVRTADREWLYAGYCAGWRAKGKPGALYSTADGLRWQQAKVFSEAECWTVAAGETARVLYAATRQEGGHGKIYRTEFK